MSEKNNIRVAEEYGEALNAHDYARVSSYHDEGFQYQGPGTPGPVDEATHQALMERNWTAFPDLTSETSQIVAQGDSVVVNWIASGTHDGPLATRTGETLPPTGRKSAILGSATMGFKDGKIVWQHDYYDAMTVLANIGAVPGA